MEPAYILLWKDHFKRKYYVSQKPFYLYHNNGDFIFSYQQPSSDFLKVYKEDDKICIETQGKHLKQAETLKKKLCLRSREFFSFYSYDFLAETHKVYNNFTFTGIFNDERFNKMMALANMDSPIIVTGDTGVGKELFAKNLHYNSHRRHNPIEVVDCSLREDEIETQLFGAVKGAYTGLNRDKVGLFKKLHGGTIILDNIEQLSHRLQVSLLRTLENNEVRALGSNEVFKHNVRVIVISNRSFYELLENNYIRKDLFYRLEQNWVNIPLLRDRKDEFNQLIEFFLGHKLSKDKTDYLQSLAWTGNVRELKNYLEKVKIFDTFINPDVKVDNSAWQNSFGKATHNTFNSLVDKYKLMLNIKKQTFYFGLK